MNNPHVRPLLPKILSVLLITTSCLVAADWPHWLGPNGDNKTTADASFDPDLSKWKVAWKAGVGHGYSSVAVADGHAYTLGHDGGSQETVYCFDAANGNVVWKFPYEAQLMPRMHPGGPNATPTIIGRQVITVSKDGQVHCLSADKGAVVWKANLVEAMGIKLPDWGFASSPVLDDGKLYFSGGKVVAINLADGKVDWVSKADYRPGYSTTVIFNSAGGKYIATLDGKGVSILSVNGGGEIARQPFAAMFDLNATTPMILDKGKRLFVSGNKSSAMLAFDGQKLSEVWTSMDIKNAMNNSVIMDGKIYGIDGRQQTPQDRAVCINVADGKVLWAKPDFGFGNTIGIGNVILALNENGELVTFKASPANYEEISRLQILGKLCWTTPTFAEGRIYARNDKGDVVCLSR